MGAFEVQGEGVPVALATTAPVSVAGHTAVLKLTSPAGAGDRFAVVLREGTRRTRRSGGPLIVVGYAERRERGGPAVRPSPRDAYKRAFDLAVLCAGLAALAPLWVPLAAVVAAAVRCCDGGPVLYRQTRLGRHGRSFEMVKFRTMPVGADVVAGPMTSARCDAQATPVGSVLRRLRLDELPQAINVLRGEMSLVGPRPERQELAVRYARELPGFERRLTVLPGIAGLAQARRGADATAAQKLRYDLLYIESMNPWLDLKLCAACVLRVLREFRGGCRVESRGGW